MKGLPLTLQVKILRATYKEVKCSANTNKNNEWAMQTFQAWATARNIKYPTDLCPSNVFTTENYQELCNWLCKITMEPRKVDTIEYTPRSLYRTRTNFRGT